MSKKLIAENYGASTIERARQIMKKHYDLLLSVVLTIIFLFIKPILGLYTDHSKGILSILYNQSHILVTMGFSWLLILLIRKLKTTFLRKFDISIEDNLSSRKKYTQINLLEKVLIFIIILFAIGIILLSFDSIRKIGIGLFATAGVAGIIIGLSAQKVLGHYWREFKLQLPNLFELIMLYLLKMSGVGKRK